MLILVVVECWKVDLFICCMVNGVVMLGSYCVMYGEFVQVVMVLLVLVQVMLKNLLQFCIVGKLILCFDVCVKFDSLFKFGLDMCLFNMKVVVLVCLLCFGGKVVKYDVVVVKVVKGVVDVLQILIDCGGMGVVVIVDGYWLVKQGCDVLQVMWEDVGLMVFMLVLMVEYKKFVGQFGMVVKVVDMSVI